MKSQTKHIPKHNAMRGRHRYPVSKSCCLKPKEGVADLVIEGDKDARGKQKMTETDAEKAEVLAMFFSSVYTSEPAGPL